MKNNYRLLDCNYDGINEVLLNNSFENDLIKEYALVCIDKDRKLIWKYKFRDTVLSPNYIFPVNQYLCHKIFDTISFQGKNLLLCASNHISDFPGAIYLIDAKTGKRFGGIIWNPGHIVDGFFNGQKIVFSGYNNAYERIFLGVIDFDQLVNSNSVCPFTPKYELLNLNQGRLSAYILFDKSDLTNYFNSRTNNIIEGSLHFEKYLPGYSFSVKEADKFCLSNAYRISEDFINVQLTISSDFRVKRDSLVKNGIIKEPYSDTPEYCKILIDGIRYWDGEKFISRKEWLEKLRSLSTP